MLSEDVGSEDNDDGNNDGGDGNADDCADDDDFVYIVIVIFAVYNRSDDNGYSIGIILVWCEG